MTGNRTGAVAAAGDPAATPGRRRLTAAVTVGAAGAALALWAASRTWVVEVTLRPDPLPAVALPQTGGSLVPALPASALVALAGAAGLLATRGRARRAVGLLLVGAGLGMLCAGGYAVAGLAGVAVVWPAVAAAAGLAVVSAGLFAAGDGQRWPAMSARYERAPTRPQVRPGPTEPASAVLWDAIDRGADPTVWH